MEMPWVSKRLYDAEYKALRKKHNFGDVIREMDNDQLAEWLTCITTRSRAEWLEVLEKEIPNGKEQ